MAIDEKLERDVALAQAGIAAEVADGVLARTLERRRTKLSEKMFKALDQGTLSMSAALAGWAQLRELEGISAELKAIRQRGSSARERANRRTIELSGGVTPAN